MNTLRNTGIIIALVGFCMFALQVSCNCRPRAACGKVTTKVWSHITGACYVIVRSNANPSDPLYLYCDTLVWPGIEIRQQYCGRVMETN